MTPLVICSLKGQGHTREVRRQQLGPIHHVS